MIKVSFQYDAQDPLSSDFFNWLSAIPLDKDHMRLTTSIDYVDPKAADPKRAAHHVGDIVIETQSSFGEERENTESERGGLLSKWRKRRETAPDRAVRSAAPDADPVPDRVMFNPAPYDQPTLQTQTVNEDLGGDMAFGSDMDDFLMNDILFGDNELSEPLPDEDNQWNDQSNDNLTVSDQGSVLSSGSEKTESSYGKGTGSFTHFTEANASIQYADSETLDFLLDALDDFDQ